MSTDTARVWVFQNGAFRRAAGVYRSVSAQPSWVVRATMTAFVLVFFVPIAILALLALVAAVVVFSALSGVVWIARRVRGVVPHHDGRSNVRVIQRDGSR